MFPVDRNAVVGVKATVRLTPTLGVFPKAPNVDMVGSFGYSVGDATSILDIIPLTQSQSRVPLYFGLGVRDTCRGFV